MSLTSAVKRVTIFCHDMGKSLSLYRDIMGFEVIEDKQISGAAMAGMIGLDDCRMHICHLQAENSEDGLIGLYEISEPSPALPEVQVPTASSVSYGQATIVVNTRRLDQIYPKLVAGGYRFVCEPREYTKETDSEYLKAGTYTETIFVEPDGLLVSLMYYVPFS